MESPPSDRDETDRTRSHDVIEACCDVTDENGDDSWPERYVTEADLDEVLQRGASERSIAYNRSESVHRHQDTEQDSQNVTVTKRDAAHGTSSGTGISRDGTAPGRDGTGSGSGVSEAMRFGRQSSRYEGDVDQEYWMVVDHVPSRISIPVVSRGISDMETLF